MPQPELRTSSSAWLEGVLRMFEAEGLDVPSLLRDAGFDPESLLRQNARIPVDEVTVLWQRAVARAGRPTLGLHRGLAATHSKLGTVAHVMACCVDLGEAMDRLARYMPVISDATAFSVQPRGARPLDGDAAHGRQPADPAPARRVRPAHHADAVPLADPARDGAAGDRVRLSAPDDDRPHREAFGCEVRFGAPANRMLLSAANLAMTLPTSHPELGEMQEHLLDDQLDQLGQTTTSTLVCAEIARRLPHGEPRRQDVASGLGLAERTLQRRLQEESVSFQALLDRTRRELAQQYLAQERHTLTDVADLLGFVDSSNFFRACKRWFGLPPAQYRTRLWHGEGANLPLLRAAA